MKPSPQSRYPDYYARKVVYLDLDGVVIDFCSSALRLLGLDHKYDTTDIDCWDGLNHLVEREGLCDKGEGAHYVWSRIDAQGAEFWAGMDSLHPGMVLLSSLLANKVPVVFVSAPSRDPGSAAGKLQWLQDNIPDEEYLGRPLNRCFALCPSKHLLAHGNAVLVDDRPLNVERFQASGGTAMVWPQPWNTSGTLDYIRAVDTVLKKALW